MDTTKKTHANTQTVIPDNVNTSVLPTCPSVNQCVWMSNQRAFVLPWNVVTHLKKHININPHFYPNYVDISVSLLMIYLTEVTVIYGMYRTMSQR
jgi:hypothetical protein